MSAKAECRHCNKPIYRDKDGWWHLRLEDFLGGGCAKADPLKEDVARLHRNPETIERIRAALADSSTDVEFPSR